MLQDFDNQIIIASDHGPILVIDINVLEYLLVGCQPTAAMRQRCWNFFRFQQTLRSDYRYQGQTVLSDFFDGITCHVWQNHQVYQGYQQRLRNHPDYLIWQNTVADNKHRIAIPSSINLPALGIVIDPSSSDHSVALERAIAVVRSGCFGTAHPK